MYEKLRPHIGHEIVCVCYGRYKENPVDICIECETCNEVLISSETENQELNKTEESEEQQYGIRKHPARTPED